MPSTDHRLWLVRHGETDWSLSGKHTSVTDLPLTDHGRVQAAALVPVLAKGHFTKVLTSPRQRARVTCDIAGLGAVATVDDDLAEWAYGSYEGRTSAEIHGERPDWCLWTDGCPGGESPEQIAQRLDGLLARVEQLDGDVALFAHGHVLRALALRYLGWPMPMGAQLGLDTATVCKLGPVSDRPAILTWNVR